MIKIDYVGNDNKILNGFNNIISIQARMIDRQSIVIVSADALVIDCEFIGIKELISLDYSIKKCYYISNEKEKNEIDSIDLELLRIKNITIIPPRRTTDQIIKIIVDDIFNISDENNVYSFFGADSKVGTTSICYNSIFSIAKRNKEKSFIMLILDGQDGTEWICRHEDIKSISDIMIMLDNNMLTHDGIKSGCRLVENLYILKGEGNLKESIYYHESQIINLISFCKKAFDAVFIDAGSVMNLYLRMTYAALIESDNRILITDQSIKSNRMFQKGREQVLKDLSIDAFKYIVINKYRKSRSLLRKEEVIEKYKLPVFCTIPYIEYTEHAMADSDSSELLLNQAYEDEIKNIVKYLEGKMGINTTINHTGSIARSFMKKVKVWI